MKFKAAVKKNKFIDRDIEKLKEQKVSMEWKEFTNDNTDNLSVTLEAIEDGRLYDGHEFILKFDETDTHTKQVIAGMDIQNLHALKKLLNRVL